MTNYKDAKLAEQLMKEYEDELYDMYNCLASYWYDLKCFRDQLPYNSQGYDGPTKNQLRHCTVSCERLERDLFNAINRHINRGEMENRFERRVKENE